MSRNSTTQRDATALIVALLLISLPWTLRPVLPAPAADALVGVSAVAAMLIVLSAIHVRGFRCTLQLRPLQFVGAISFSLYLVHEPIVVACAFAFGQRLPGLYLPLGFVLSIVAAVLFNLLVERPSNRFARAVGGRVGRFGAPRTGQTT